MARMSRNQNPHIPPVRRKNGTATKVNKTGWQFLKKLKMEILYAPEILLLRVYLIKSKEGSQRDIWTSMFRASLLTIANM